MLNKSTFGYLADNTYAVYMQQYFRRFDGFRANVMPFFFLSSSYSPSETAEPVQKRPMLHCVYPSNTMFGAAVSPQKLAEEGGSAS